MRTFEEISKELNASLLDVWEKKDNKAKAEAKANEMMNEANKIRKEANEALTSAQDKAVELRKEAESLLNELAPLNMDSRVRQSK